MKIWIVNHYAVPPTSAGGTRHFNFAKELISRGHDVTIIAANYDHFSQQFVQSSDGEIDHTYQVPFVWIPTPSYSGNTIARFWNMLVFSWRLLQKKYLPFTSPPDVIIGSSPHLFAAYSAKLLAKRCKIPFILEVRDLWPESLVDLGRISHYHPLILLMKTVERNLYKHSDKIISLLPDARKYLHSQGVADEKILWLPNAVDSEKIPKDIAYVPQDKFTVMYAGAHGLANDLDTVLEAALILQSTTLEKNIRICLVGEGPEKSRLKKAAEQKGLTIIEFIDAVPKNEIYSLLNKADAFLMLLKKSPVFRFGISPNKLFDYLAMGRPVLFGVETNYNPIVKYQAVITIEPSQPELLAKAIQQLSMTSVDERKAMGARGKKFVMEQHHVGYLTHLLEDSIIHLLGINKESTVSGSIHD